MKLNAATSDQKLAWAYYGAPDRGATRRESNKTVGEVRYVIGWVADQMVRMRWRVKINGSEKWALTLPEDHGGGVIISDPEITSTDDPRHPVNASVELLNRIDWNARTVRQVSTNLFVAGELHYMLDILPEGKKWRVVSVIREDREKIAKRSSIIVHGLWPHPADPEAPDAPLMGSLTILDDMMWLNRLSRSQSSNRAGMRGILAVADSFTTANGASGDEFWQDLVASLSKPMDDPEDLSPAGIVGAQELVEPSGSGAKGLSWIIPDFPYDDKIDSRMEALIKRLSYSMPVPPEILTGMQAQSRATAFQVEESSYRAHIEPVALLVADVATDTLAAFLPDSVVPTVNPDPTALLARRHSVSDVLEAFAIGAVSYAYVREVLDIPETATPTMEDLLWRREFMVTLGSVESDPGVLAAEEPIRAAATLPGDLPEEDPGDVSRDDARLAESLERIDHAVLHELVGAGYQAISRAREKMGARLRSVPSAKALVAKGMTNEALGGMIVKLGRGEAFTVGDGIDFDEIVAAAISPVLEWWAGRAEDARTQVTLVLRQYGVDAPAFLSTSLRESVDVLRALLEELVWSDSAPADASFRAVVEIAGN